VGIASRIQETLYRATGRTELAEVVRDKRAAMAMVSHLQESIADLEARMYEPGWQKLTAMAEQEFSREGLRQITAVNRLMALKNPLVKRGLALRMAYIWGQAFLDDPGNNRCLTGRANAQLKSWRILRKLRCSPSKAGHLCKAIAVLQNHRVAQAA
jgi:hypothetical protein